MMHTGGTEESGRRAAPGGWTNRQRIARYDLVVAKAKRRADEAHSLAVRRKYINLILRLHARVLRELDRGR